MITNGDFSDYDFRYHQGLNSPNSFEAMMSKHGYEEFIDAHPELDDLTYRQWVDLISAMNEQAEKPMLNFVPPSNLGTLGTAAASALAGKALNLGRNANIDDILSAGADFLRQQVRENVSRVTINPADGIGGNGDGGDGGTTQADYAGGSNFNPTGLSLNLKPIDTKFVTNIVPLYRPKFFLDGTDNNAPLIIKFRNVFPEYTEATSPDFWGGNVDIQRYLENKVTSNWVNTISFRVKLNSFLSPLVNFKHIMNYYRIMSYSLAVLYFYRSIDAHFKMDGNRNDAMISLYKSLSADEIRQAGILAQILDEIPLDPMVNEFMFHLYDNYKQSHLPGSPLLKFSPICFLPTTDNNFTALQNSQVINCINMLKSKPFRDFQQVMVQAFPDTVKNKTLSYSGIPKFDANWQTCFINQTFISNNDQMKPAVTDQTTSVTLNLLTDAPDGWIDAANNIFNSTSGNMEAGFGGPKYLTFNASQPTNLFPESQSTHSVYASGGQNHVTDSFIYATDTNNAGVEVQSFFPLEYRERYQILSGNTFKYVLGVSGIKTFQRAGAELAIPRTIRDAVPICNQFADLMYGPSKLVNSSKSSAYSDAIDDKEDTKPRRRRRRRK